jgi:hypothetical protein
LLQAAERLFAAGRRFGQSSAPLFWEQLWA